ncbi:GNAT family N-acetyltransferase [Streptomyces sp. NBC_00249]|uniref:GNAT family N-acetyltransferase n=1 Tax=Streptomyces sp. NBC_00249 TaxID=2975690 RepID=UPI00225622F4|nr:GNAT family N-acetyltransferase [Streptomyces sp. NBC_00249]MCX5199081.1 GNAT family N-acetyltransferase [Streptomyces sp. NBC_00249]
MTLTFVMDPKVGPALYEEILDLWTEVTNAGGAVGFVPPVVPDDIRPQLLTQVGMVSDGRMRLLMGRDEEGALAAVSFLGLNQHRLMTHWIWLYTVMVHPRHQGRGYGRELLAASAEHARTIGGVEAIRLSCRGGMGLEDFYASCGYKEVGRVPDGVRVAPGDDRDDITMLLPLH